MKAGSAIDAELARLGDGIQSLREGIDDGARPDAQKIRELAARTRTFGQHTQDAGPVDNERDSDEGV